MRWILIVLCLLVAVEAGANVGVSFSGGGRGSTPAAGAESLCNTLGTYGAGGYCVCSERLNANESSTPGNYIDFSDSSTRECGSTGLIGYSVVGFTSVAAFDMPGTGVSYVKAIVGGGGNDSIDGTHMTFSTGTLCARMYQRFSSDWPTAVGDSNQPVRQKLSEISGTYNGNSALFLQSQWNPFVDRIKAENSSSIWDEDLSWTGGTVTLQDCKDSWCRLETCVDKLSDGRTRGRFRAVVVDTGETATFLPSGWGTTSGMINVDRVWFGNLDRQYGSGTGTRYMSHAIQTFIPAGDETFWPGEACELEGGC